MPLLILRKRLLPCSRLAWCEGAVVRIAHQVSGPAQVAPTMANRIAFEIALRGLEPFPGILLGGARRFGFDGLNDQIADALYHLGATLC
jgi:hypothetical protein